MACSCDSYLATSRNAAPFSTLDNTQIVHPHYSTNHQHEPAKCTGRQVDTKSQRLGARSRPTTATWLVFRWQSSLLHRMEDKNDSRLEEMTDKTEKQKIKFVMDRTRGRAFQRLRRRLPWSNQPDNDAFKTHDEVLNHLERQFGDLDCQAYPEPSDLKQKDDEPFDHFLVRWEHWVLAFDVSEREMVADLNRRLNHWCRSSHLPNTLRELASGCRKREWERKPSSLTSLIDFGIGLALLDSMCSDPTPN